MQVNEKEIQELEQKISKLESDLKKSRERLYKIKPQNPLIHDRRKYDKKTKSLVTYYEYYCPNCGWQMRKPESKAVSRHKCGQMIQWK